MRHSILTLAVLLPFSILLFAQHASGGGGGSSGGASASGGSHGGGSSSGGSASSHSSGGSASHGSGSHSSGAHSSGKASAHLGAQTKTAPPEKRSFFSFLRHPFRKPEAKEVVELRRRICPNGRCMICPAGSAGRWGCAGVAANNFCTRQEILGGGNCVLQAHFLDDCSSFLLAVQWQRRIMHAAESARQGACAAGPTPECADFTGKAQSQASLYQTYLDRYRQCRERSLTAQPYGGYAFGRYSPSVMFDPLWTDFQ
jgi:hypothetical protein